MATLESGWCFLGACSSSKAACDFYAPRVRNFCPSGFLQGVFRQMVTGSKSSGDNDSWFFRSQVWPRLLVCWNRRAEALWRIFIPGRCAHSGCSKSGPDLGSGRWLSGIRTGAISRRHIRAPSTSSCDCFTYGRPTALSFTKSTIFSFEKARTSWSS